MEVDMSTDSNTAVVDQRADMDEPEDHARLSANGESNSDTIEMVDPQNAEVIVPTFQSLHASRQNGGAPNDIDLILDIPVSMTVELGRTKVPIRNILEITQGAVIELDAAAGDPLDVLVNGCLIAKGEVVVVNDKFGIRLTDIITPSERIQKLNR
jgi:flagellar motor switch protein FliN